MTTTTTEQVRVTPVPTEQTLVERLAQVERDIAHIKQHLRDLQGDSK